MTFDVRATPSADAQVRALDKWWRANRSKAPKRFKVQYERALDVLGERPEVGAPYQRRGFPGLRRYRLQRTPYHVYYVTNVEAAEVLVPPFGARSVDVDHHFVEETPASTFQIFAKSPETLHHRFRSFQKLTESRIVVGPREGRKREDEEEDEASIGSPYDVDA